LASSFVLPRRPPRSPLFPYTTLFRSRGRASCRATPRVACNEAAADGHRAAGVPVWTQLAATCPPCAGGARTSCRLRLCRSQSGRSEEHTSELQSRENLVCRLLLEKKK